MSKPIKLTPNEWRSIRDELHLRYPPSYFIRSKMRAKLGFTVREHRDWQPNKDYQKELADYRRLTDINRINGDVWAQLHVDPSRGNYVDQVHLDFYDERKKSLFLLTYGDKIEFDDPKT